MFFAVWSFLRFSTFHFHKVKCWAILLSNRLEPHTPAWLCKYRKLMNIKRSYLNELLETNIAAVKWLLIAVKAPEFRLLHFFSVQHQNSGTKKKHKFDSVANNYNTEQKLLSQDSIIQTFSEDGRVETLFSTDGKILNHIQIICEILHTQRLNDWDMIHQKISGNNIWYYFELI